MILLDPSTVRRKKLQNGVFTLKTAHQIFSVHIMRENLKTQQSAVSLDSRLGKSRDYRDAIVFENLRFSKRFPFTLKRKTENRQPAFSNSSDLKSASEKFPFLPECGR